MATMQSDMADSRHPYTAAQQASIAKLKKWHPEFFNWNPEADNPRGDGQSWTIGRYRSPTGAAFALLQGSDHGFFERGWVIREEDGFVAQAKYGIGIYEEFHPLD